MEEEKVLTIRERIQQYSSEILSKNYTPQRVAEILLEASAIYSNVLEEVKQRDIAYNKLLLDCLDSEKTANRARIKANITPEYELMRDAHNAEKVILEMTKNAKKWLRMQEEEYRMGSNF